MEKTVWLFRKNLNRDREEFRRHYIGNHAPLGKKLTRHLLGYTVNLVLSEYPGGPDSVTEHWVHDVADLLDPSRAYASPAERNEVVVDDRWLFDGFAFPHVIVDETEVIPGEPSTTPLEEATPGVKLIWTFADAKDAPPPPKGARRVVDSRVDRRLAFDGLRVAVERPEFTLLRSAWFDDVESSGAAVRGALISKEYRFIEAPRWN